MRFTQGRRRPAPSVIIVSLIDVLLVVLIFLMVSSTLRQTPSVKLTLPEATPTQKSGASPDKLVVTIALTEPRLFLGKLPVTLERLQQELERQAARNTNLSLAIEADKSVPWEQVLQVMGAARAAKLRSVEAIIKTQGGK